MRRALAPVLFDDQNPANGPHPRWLPHSAPFPPGERRKRKRNSDGLPVQSFQDWLKDLATITKNHSLS